MIAVEVQMIPLSKEDDIRICMNFCLICADKIIITVKITQTEKYVAGSQEILLENLYNFLVRYVCLSW